MGKRHFKNFVKSFVAVLLVFVLVFSDCSFISYAKTYYKETFWEEFPKDARTFCFYIASQIGAICTLDFSGYITNLETWEDYWSEDYVSFDEDTQNITFDAEFMAYVKSALNEYAASTEGYTIMQTVPISYIDPDNFVLNYEYQTARNVINNSSCGMAAFSVPKYTSTSNYFVFYDLDCFDFSSCSFVSVGPRCVVYDNNLWSNITSPALSFMCRSLTQSYSSFDDLVSSGYSSSEGNRYFTLYSDLSSYDVHEPNLYSTDGRNIRVYNSLSALKSYTAGQSRNVYYTSNYYNYEAVDTTVSVSDLESIAAAVEDIADQMDTLVTISDTESEIEELLQSLLDQVVQNSTNDDGSTTSEATGSTVVYYSPVTTSWLDSVSDYLKNILEQIKESNSLLSGLVELLTPEDDEADADSDVDSSDEESTWLDSITEYLDDIVELLKSIKNWTVADTVADVADAVADWADFITGFFDDADSGVASVASGLSEPVELLSGKFPFSIPWDIAFLIGFLADTPATPVFEIPLVLERYGINETFVIDLSELEALSKISRLLLTVAFIIGLLKLTEKIINVKEGK